MTAATVAAWTTLVERRYPAAHAASWDNVGLQVGDPFAYVRRVLVSLDVTGAVVAEAAEVPGTLIISHHPLLFSPLKNLTPATASGRTALAAAAAGVAILAAHTNLDVATDGSGTSTPVARLLDLQEVVALTPDEDGIGFGHLGLLSQPRPLREVAAQIRDGLPAPHLRFAGDPSRSVRRVAVVGGAGDGLIEAARAAQADVYVTGDLRHHVTLDALEQGLSVIDAGHHATEWAAMRHFADRIREDALANGLPGAVVLSTIDTCPWNRGDA